MYSEVAESIGTKEKKYTVHEIEIFPLDDALIERNKLHQYKSI